MEIKLETLTPVHIGTGNSYGRVEYFTTENRINRLSFSDLYRKLDEENRETLLRGLEEVSRISDEISKLTEEIKKARKRKDRKLENLRGEKRRKEQELKTKSIELQNFFAKFSDIKILYSYPVLNLDDLKDDLRGEIREQIKTSNYLPYIPGSSIKGAIRTALLWRYIKDNADNRWKTRICYEDRKEIKGET
ncbi:MAG: type III-A CRISPR-associated RAMP protein Csm5, partial [Candidatus Altiarchaeales archaeon]